MPTNTTLRNAVIQRGKKIGTLPATGDPYFVLDGAAYLVTNRGLVHCGDYFEFMHKTREGKVRFQPAV